LGLSRAGDKGGPRDPQPGNTPGGGYDTSGGPEDDRGTAMPLSTSTMKSAASMVSISQPAAPALTTASPLVVFNSATQIAQKDAILSEDDRKGRWEKDKYVIRLRVHHRSHSHRLSRGKHHERFE
jgi:hypothetical protein